MKNLLIIISLLIPAANLFSQDLYDIFQTVNKYYETDSICYTYTKVIKYYQDDALVKTDSLAGNYYKAGKYFLNAYDNVKIFGDTVLLCLYVAEDKTAVVQENKGAGILTGSTFGTEEYISTLKNYTNWSLDTISDEKYVLDIFLNETDRLRMTYNPLQRKLLAIETFQVFGNNRLISAMYINVLPNEELKKLSPYEFDLSLASSEETIKTLFGEDTKVLNPRP